MKDPFIPQDPLVHQLPIRHHFEYEELFGNSFCRDLTVARFLFRSDTAPRVLSPFKYLGLLIKLHQIELKKSCSIAMTPLITVLYIFAYVCSVRLEVSHTRKRHGLLVLSNQGFLHTDFCTSVYQYNTMIPNHRPFSRRAVWKNLPYSPSRAHLSASPNPNLTARMTALSFSLPLNFLTFLRKILIR